MPETRKLFIETVGCQMNVLDSELVVASLRREGYELTPNLLDADAILFNTCSVRQHAEDKIYSALGRIKRLKTSRPDVLIGVLGCMAQKDQKQILKRAPHVDLVVGPGQIDKVPQLLEKARAERAPQLALSLARNAGRRDTITESFVSYDPLREPTMRPSPHQAYVRIMMGCDKFCTFCIVPAVRGPEQSRPPDQILDEAKALIDQGVREITLLGQTVNSYKYKNGDAATHRLSDLLDRLHALEGLVRIKFITNYPTDMTDDLLQAVRELPKVCRYLHVPAKSGCDVMLKRMKRSYSVGFYEEMLARIRAAIPDCAISSDFIVGFSGETEDAFERSLALVERAGFKNSFIFKYSPRPGTKAFDLLPDDVPDEIKKRRNNDLLAAQSKVSQALNQQFVGTVREVLVEGRSDWSADSAESGAILQLTGRTMCDRIVVFDGPARLEGQLVPVRIESASPVTLFGNAITEQTAHGQPRPASKLPALTVLAN